MVEVQNSKTCLVSDGIGMQRVKNVNFSQQNWTK